ncbi:pyruvate dehydrogenase E2 component (dihydrolipoamide acetyltransferase) [Alkalispirochaeta americana]|uniref:Dihydrolipoamide acetyltransferase component of pyruvate dehydrogenase complex n=1 Tax=Alkalispirochaeta americana TaxID=159291 RepID=A0A1N6NYW8_9SPIO|nr:dihydrolipoamide acetyltransferase family protein [Alkalispirochaeta americana]SIP97206.1 pyruvate dehydrogenase E2 component (dihydrolipoamide acetyltransferase) [Alkalispirochaeta americana]
MAEKIPMTALSPTMEEGTIVSWSKKEGDPVVAGDVLCEVETDKTTVEYESSQEGTLLKIILGADERAAVGRTIAVIGESGEDISGFLKEIEQEGASGSEEGSRGSSKDAPKQDGGAEGAPKESPQEAPREEPVEEVVSRDSSDSGEDDPGEDDSLGAGRQGRSPASPLAVKMAARKNVPLHLVKGTGPGGRIVKRDIEAFRGVPGGAGSWSEGARDDAAHGHAGAIQDRTVPVAGARAVIAERLSESKFSAPHYYLTNSVEMDRLQELRSAINGPSDAKISLNAFFIKLVAEALKRHRGINALWQGKEIVEKGSIDIGLAVDAGKGLITPVVRNCGARGVREIDQDLQGLIEKARQGTLKSQEYTGATFTISNLGSFGVEEFTAIINPPGSAILALGASKPSPVVRSDGSLGVATVMKMTLSCDHRVIDGAAGGRFLKELQQLLEEPGRAIL